MDDRRFDALAKTFPAAASRRGLLAGLLASLSLGGEAGAEPGAEGKAGGRDGGKRHGRNRGNGRNRTGRRKGRGGGKPGGRRPRRYGMACGADGQCATGRCAGGFCGCASSADCPGDGPVCQDNGTCTTGCVPSSTLLSVCPLPGCTGCTYLSDVPRVCRGEVCLPETVGCSAGSADCPFGSVCGESAVEACCGGPFDCSVCYTVGEVCSG